MAPASPIDDIVFLDDHRLLVCKKCKHAIPSSLLITHVKSPKHDLKLAAAILEALKLWAIELNAIEDPSLSRIRGKIMQYTEFLWYQAYFAMTAHS
jgi:hypothetical protein